MEARRAPPAIHGATTHRLPQGRVVEIHAIAESHAEESIHLPN
jgi:hypothetical protein